MALLLTSVFGVTGCGSDDGEAPVKSRIKNSTIDDMDDDFSPVDMIDDMDDTRTCQVRRGWKQEMEITRKAEG
jgi:hypothetical protein